MATYGYFWNAGYWGPYVGYYGGINYGFGYFGIGFYGGYWGGGRFWYNRAYCNLGYGHGFHNVYNRPYNGYSGHPGGTSFVRTTLDSRQSRSRRNCLPRLQHQRPHVELCSGHKPLERTTAPPTTSLAPTTEPATTATRSVASTEPIITTTRSAASHNLPHAASRNP